jgi:hypothetical protein
MGWRASIGRAERTVGRLGALALVPWLALTASSSFADPSQCSNLVQDPGFESGVSGFTAQDASSQVAQTDSDPLEGSHSLLVAITGYGNNVWWIHGASSALASHWSVSAHLRSDLASSSSLKFCAMAYYAGGGTELKCTTVTGAVGDKGLVSAGVNLDSTKALASVRFRLYQEGSAPVRFSLDSAAACLDVVSPTPSPSPSPSPSPLPSPSPSPSPTPTPTPTPTPSPLPSPDPGPCLMQDPGFESGVSGFAAQVASSQVAQTDVAPLEGAHSLMVAINGYGDNVWWVYGFAGGLASRLSVGAHLRSDLASSSTLQFCAMAYYGDGSTGLNCADVTGAVGDKGWVSAALNLDSTKALETVRIRLIQEGSAGVRFTMDRASACLDVVAPPPSPTPIPTPSPSPTPSPTPSPSPSPSPTPSPCPYPGYSYNLPATRPFISLNDYAQADPASTAYVRFKAAADQALGGDPPYNYSATHSVLMYRLSGQVHYIDDAISRVEQQVQAAEAAMAGGGVPAVAGDSYYDVGWDIEQLALAYDYGYERLSGSQRLRWANYAEQTLYNVWNPSQAAWGGTPHPWSGWSIDDPGNNYHYGFLRATMLWALASQETTWFEFLQSQKFCPLVDYYAQLAGGGSREGTGYGTALKNLFENYIYWRASTGEDLAGLTSHTRDTIDYWVHATVPTLDRFAPIGDQSRSSVPELYDYHENLVHAAVALSAGTDQAKRGTWWLQNNSVDGVHNSFNLMGDLLPYRDAPVEPTELAYHAAAAGHFFARSGWDTEASWLAFVAGPYDQSHAHQDQGSFTFFKRDWLAVTSNIWSHSGIQQGVDAHNVIRFVQNGSTIPQDQSTSVQSSMTYTNSGGVVSVHADLTNAYSQHHGAVQGWTRDLELDGDVLRVHDTCSVAADVQPVFQLHVPVLPVVQPDGSIQAGGLRIVPLQPMAVNVVSMPATDPDFNGGYRIEFTTSSGCAFAVELQGQ